MAQKINIVSTGIEGKLEELIAKFKRKPQGWSAVYLQSEKAIADKWRQPSSGPLLSNMFKNTFPDIEQIIVCFLNSQEILLFAHDEEPINVEHLASELRGFLTGDEQDVGISSACYNLEKEEELAIVISYHNTYKASLDEQLKDVENKTFTLRMTADLVSRRQQQKNLQVLILEDDVATAKLLYHAIARQCHVVPTYTARQAKKSYETMAPHLVFLDIGLPDVDGFTVLEGIMRADPKAFVVMLTANGFMDNVQQAIASGAKGFIVKPFTKDKVGAYMEKCKEAFGLTT